MAKVLVTNHAVKRYIERHVPGLEFDAAHRLLMRKVIDGTPLKQRPLAGGHAWKIQGPDAVAVVRRDRRQLVVLTVLPAEEPDVPDEGEDWMFDEALRLVREGKI